jgi:ribosomal protein L7/L12
MTILEFVEKISSLSNLELSELIKQLEEKFGLNK